MTERGQEELTHLSSMKHKNFTEWLQFKHHELHPMLLDDDLPDAFDDWIGEIDGAQMLEWVEEYEAEKST